MINVVPPEIPDVDLPAQWYLADLEILLRAYFDGHDKMTPETSDLMKHAIFSRYCDVIYRGLEREAKELVKVWYVT